MSCDGVLHSHRILKTIKKLVINKKLAVLFNTFSKQTFIFYFYCQKQFCEQFLMLF